MDGENEGSSLHVGDREENRLVGARVCDGSDAVVDMKTLLAGYGIPSVNTRTRVGGHIGLER